MPNGVICGGAVDGSNQLGEIVTCHAMVTRPAGGAAAAVLAVAPKAATARSASRGSTRRNRRTGYNVMRTPQAPIRSDKLERRREDGLQLCASQSRVASGGYLCSPD